MKRPNTYVVDSFVSYMDEEEIKLSFKNSNYLQRELSHKKQSVIKTIRNTILSSTLHTDLDEATIVKYYKKVSTNKTYQSLKEHLYFTAVKNQRLVSIHKIFESAYEKTTFNIEKFFNQVNDYNGIYFLPVDNKQSVEFENKLGVIIKGIESEFEDFYENLNIPFLKTTELMEGVEKNSHIANSMVILDPYIFIDDNKRTPKIPNIIKTIKHFIPQDLAIPFTVTIVTKNAENNLLFENKRKQIVDGLGGKEKVSVEVFAPKTINESDRYVITNYSLMTAGHPFDRTTSFSCNFLISCVDDNTVLKKYEDWDNKLCQIKTIINNTPDFYGNIKASFYDETSKNRLLHHC